MLIYFEIYLEDRLVVIPSPSFTLDKYTTMISSRRICIINFDKLLLGDQEEPILEDEQKQSRKGVNRILLQTQNSVYIFSNNLIFTDSRSSIVIFIIFLTGIIAIYVPFF